MIWVALTPGATLSFLSGDAMGRGEAEDRLAVLGCTAWIPTPNMG